MKKLLTLFLALTLMCVCLFGMSSVAYAEEPEQPVATVSETDTENLETIKEKLNALIAKHNSEIETGKNFFITRVLPLLIASAISTILGFIFGGVFRKGNKDFKNKYNQAAISYNALEKQYNELKAEKENAITVMAWCKNTLLPAVANLQTENAELKTEITEIKQKVNSVHAGATQAWAECPDAIRELGKTVE